jgi:hypothetical protein
MDVGETRQGMGRQDRWRFLCNSRPKRLKEEEEEEEVKHEDLVSENCV